MSQSDIGFLDPDRIGPLTADEWRRFLRWVVALPDDAVLAAVAYLSTGDNSRLKGVLLGLPPEELALDLAFR